MTPIATAATRIAPIKLPRSTGRFQLPEGGEGGFAAAGFEAAAGGFGGGGSGVFEPGGGDTGAFSVVAHDPCGDCGILVAGMPGGGAGGFTAGAAGSGG